MPMIFVNLVMTRTDRISGVAPGMALVAVTAVVHIPADIRVTEIRRVSAAVAIRTLEH